jgi:CheY-like chemotaxis protein
VLQTHDGEDGDDGEVVVEVSDDGAGIPEEVLGRIFEPFFTTKPIGTGSGLGLYICQDIVRQLGGRIEVESRVGEGSTFRVHLPRSEEPPEAAPGPEHPVSTVRRRVLVVDDEPLIVRTFRKSLAQHEVESAGDGDEAKQHLLEDRRDYDVIFCDLIMPGTSGMALYEAVSGQRPEMAHRFVFMTGGTFTDQARRFVDAHRERTLDKPLDMQQIRRIVAEASPERD